MCIRDRVGRPSRWGPLFGGACRPFEPPAHGASHPRGSQAVRAWGCPRARPPGVACRSEVAAHARARY
eukprot:1765867-Alexandrium_andersonii.AAC.1